MGRPLDALSRELIAQGRWIEAGFTLRIMPIVEASDPELTEALRSAFFSGAHHLLVCIAAGLDPATLEPTPEDAARMDRIERELNEFVRDFATRQLAVKGTA